MKKNLLIPIVMILLVLLSTLSGCIYTVSWSHANEDGTSVTFIGKLSSFFNKNNWAVGFVYDDEFHSSWEDYQNYIEAEEYFIFNTFYATVDSLDRNESIHFRAVARWLTPTNRTFQSFDIEIKPGWPSVKTEEASYIELNSVTLNGELLHMGGASECEVWFEYGDSEENLNRSTSKKRLSSPGSFNEAIGQLNSCQTYYYKAMAKNDIGTVDGRIESVTPGGPSVSTKFATDVEISTAVLNGKLYDMGGTQSCEVWFEYGLSGDNLEFSTEPITLTSVDDFSISVSGLSSYTTYYFRAKADNGICVGAGSIIDFETEPAPLQAVSVFSDRDLSLKSVIQFVKQI